MGCYTRKLRVELQGGPAVNRRREDDVVSRKRKKLGATQSWFTRRRGGQMEKDRKDHGWRTAPQDPQGRGIRGRRTLAKYPKANIQTEPDSKQPRTIATLLVPYSVGSTLMKRMQEAEDRLATVLGGGRVRMIEKGGDVLSHLLTRNDPWASRQTCTDTSCETCNSWTWLPGGAQGSQEVRSRPPKVSSAEDVPTVQEGGGELPPPVLALCTGGGEVCLLG